ncbi:hypothetical protein CCACVL1_24023 [Corchorus capsularis]|uniref:Uncharacterized protein n=1 Tax=Corchorus capsularis TaxID=210143 RepID=A0A1R3GR90_COCAP|nr:hypothetical protein CCACVL1_24023 [Corchorus capsularis]
MPKTTACHQGKTSVALTLRKMSDYTESHAENHRLPPGEDISSSHIE